MDDELGGRRIGWGRPHAVELCFQLSSTLFYSSCLFFFTMAETEPSFRGVFFSFCLFFGGGGIISCLLLPPSSSIIIVIIVIIVAVLLGLAS